MNREFALFALITTCVGAVMTAATLPYDDNVMFWAILLGGYFVLSAISVFVLLRQKNLFDLFKLRGGDLSLGIVSGFVLTGAALFALRYLAPLTEPRGAWLLTLYAQVGDIQASLFCTVGLIGVVLGEELVWRGLVLTRALKLWGPKVAIPASALLYSVAHAPTLMTLAVPGLGYNPLLVAGALVMGLVWGVMVWLNQRLVPAIVCHLVFSYFVAGPTPDWLF
jgi:membrane protease YdiL (CAAX protease family)